MCDGPFTIRNTGPSVVSVRAFLVSDDVIHMRTTAVNGTSLGSIGPFAELFFFSFLKKDGKERPLRLS